MSLGGKLFKSASVLIGIKFIHRFIGLISLLILARLLTPTDFGLVAIISIVVHFFDVISNVGSEQYIIQKDTVSSQDINTAWTLNLIAKVLLWLLLVLTSPLFAMFFEQPNLVPALVLASSVLIIDALKSPGIFILKRNFNYDKIFKLSIAQKIVSFIIVITIAYYSRSYWALIIAEISSSVVFTVGTYLICSHKPKLIFIHLKEQWFFSRWLLFKGIVGYTRSQIDTIIVAKYFPTGLLGKYYMSRDIAMMPAHNILVPATEPLLAALRQTRNDLILFRRQTSASLYAIAVISVPIFFFIWYFSLPILATLLGEQWIESENILHFMSLLFLYFSFILVIEQALLALQKVKLLFYFDFVSLLFVVLGLIILLSNNNNLAYFALIRGVLGTITAIALLLILKHYIKLEIMRLIFLISPLFLLSYCAIIITKYINIFDFDWPLLDLLANGSLFCFIYAILLTLFFIQIKKESEVTMLLKMTNLSKFNIFKEK
jgi:O-antigen/teichoic acid export membrane protein